MSESGPPPVDHAAPFAAMAARIEANQRGEFSGAFVVCVPGQEPMEMLLLDPVPNAAVFLATLQTRLKMRVEELEAAERTRGGRGW